MTKKIAVDVEGVLADSQAAAEGVLPPEELEGWGFSNDEYRDLFLDTLTASWHNDWENIDLVHESNRMAMILLNKFFDVDIVTARVNSDEEIQNWLDMHDIEYDNFVSTKTYKEELGYDYYIDDNPHMTDADVDLYLLDRPWNRNASAEMRVRSLLEAVTHLIQEEV